MIKFHEVGTFLFSLFAFCFNISTENTVLMQWSIGATCFTTEQ